MTQNINNDKISDDIIASDKIIMKTTIKELEDDAGNPKSPVSSTIHTIGGLSWRIEVRKVVRPNQNPQLDLYVYCNEDVKDKLWLCEVYMSMSCWYGNSGRKIRDCIGPVYGFNTYIWLFKNPKYRNDEELLNIELEIKITHIQKFFAPLDTTLVIKLDENRTAGTFAINKNLLASYSNYFHNLFFGDWSDKKKANNYFEIVETEDFDVRAFSFMIYSIMTMGGMAYMFMFKWKACDFAIQITKLSIKYDMSILVDYCKKILMRYPPKMDLLEFADQYPELNNLKEHCLNGLSIQELMKDFTKTAGIHSRLSPNTQDRLKAIMAGKTEEMSDSLEAIDDAVRSKKPRLSSMADQINKIKDILGHK